MLAESRVSPSSLQRVLCASSGSHLLALTAPLCVLLLLQSARLRNEGLCSLRLGCGRAADREVALPPLPCPCVWRGSVCCVQGLSDIELAKETSRIPRFHLQP
ncbi:hypothetical protein F2P81_017317 [Scophthalmus maximus]|uniref:Uncharacterized protein n=1 Tax=Scophthalmus maximus TaxID=52904 RepID=A0A6A4S5T8_SCOMX|nr:hypothetical protein F2P81_017317 [Scophthalmus maximus]